MEGSGRERIFLYGTLRRGGSRDVLRHYDGAEFDYPGLRLSDAAGWVAGELFDVTPAALAALDEWEGLGPGDTDLGEYRRVRLTVEREDGAAGTLETCWGYEAVAEKCAGRPVIAGGDWIVHAAAGR